MSERPSAGAHLRVVAGVACAPHRAEAERRRCQQDVLGRCRGRAHLFDRRDRSGHRLDRDDDDHGRVSELRALLVELRGNGLGAVSATPLEVCIGEDGAEVVLGLALEHDESPRAQRAVVGRGGRGVEERGELCGGRGGLASADPWIGEGRSPRARPSQQQSTPGFVGRRPLGWGERRPTAEPPVWWVRWRHRRRR